MYHAVHSVFFLFCNFGHEGMLTMPTYTLPVLLSISRNQTALCACPDSESLRVWCQLLDHHALVLCVSCCAMRSLKFLRQGIVTLGHFGHVPSEV